MSTLLDQVFAAGVVGCGGAGFPTHAKLNAQVEYLLLNGAECEPLLRTDRYLMQTHAKEIITAAVAVRAQLSADYCVIALKAAYKQEIKALTQAIEQLNAPVTLHLLDSFYPAGDEQVIVHEVTGRTVPPAGIPLNVGCVVSNVATMVAVYDAMQKIPFTEKYLTVTGEVHTPTILHVPVGTSIRECIALAGGVTCEDYYVISGGPMMGQPLTKEQAECAMVTKTTSGILVLPADSRLAANHQVSLEKMLNRASSVCIQCNFCTQLCPRHLMGHPLEPHRIMRKLALSPDIETVITEPEILQAQLCCECGICELYACPMQLQPRRVNAVLKQELAKRGMRFQNDKQSCIENPSREMRKVPSHRAAVRTGVLKYYNYDISQFVSYVPKEVQIPLKQHIGLPAEAVVTKGYFVHKGELIAKCPEGKLGANMHASIDGTVVSVNDSIVIAAE